MRKTYYLRIYIITKLRLQPKKRKIFTEKKFQPKILNSSNKLLIFQPKLSKFQLKKCQTLIVK